MDFRLLSMILTMKDPRDAHNCQNSPAVPVASVPRNKKLIDQNKCPSKMWVCIGLLKVYFISIDKKKKKALCGKLFYYVFFSYLWISVLKLGIYLLVVILPSFLVSSLVSQD